MGEIKVVNGNKCVNGYQPSCEHCRLASICLPVALSESDIGRLDAIVHHRKPLHKGDHLFFEGDAFQAVYAVRTGCIKTYKTGEDGEEMVTGFYFPGEIFGAEGIVSQCHTVSAQALETSALCAIPFAKLEKLSSEIPELMHRFYEVMSHEIVQDQQFIAMLNRSSSELRVAALILNISSRISRENEYATEFRLPMLRSEFASYLGLTIETVSRIISRYNKEGLMNITGNQVQINAIPALLSLTAGELPSA